MHIQTVHQDQRYIWDETRGLLDDSACAHCGHTFSSKQGVRNHIEFGRCPCFDPTKEKEETPPVPDGWHDALQKGTFGLLFQQPAIQKEWSQVCCICRRSFLRPQDVMKHLQVEHGKHWDLSNNILLLLLNTLGQALQCVCSPTVQQLRPGHVCVPIAQLAMLMVRQTDDFHIPWQISAHQLNRCLHPNLPEELRHRLAEIFAQRDFPRLWLDSGVAAAFRLKCCYCDASVTHPALMHAHVMEEHFLMVQGGRHMLDMLATCWPHFSPQ